jgi:hypothetical protein
MEQCLLVSEQAMVILAAFDLHYLAFLNIFYDDFITLS